MAKTKQDVIDDLMEAANGCKSFEEMILSIATYIVKNYKLKMVILTNIPKNKEVKNGTED